MYLHMSPTLLFTIHSCTIFWKAIGIVVGLCALYGVVKALVWAITVRLNSFQTEYSHLRPEMLSPPLRVLKDNRNGRVHWNAWAQPIDTTIPMQ